MSAGTVIALITAVTALVTALGTLLSQISHLNWHKAARQQPMVQVPPVGQQPPQS